MMTNASEGGQAWPGEGVLLVERYRLTEFVAYGGAAALWRAHDLQLERDVAIKLLLPQHHDETGSERFRQEALAIAQVQHPNVAPIFNVVEDDRLSFLVMEYVAGPTLSQFRGHPLPGRVVAAVGCQVASALGAAHDHDLIHRDVKPDNIAVDAATGHAKLLDFGIVKDLRNDSGVTGPHRVIATTRYAAPEQVSEQPVGPWTDVYCLGLVLWELCTGRPAFQGPTEPATALMRLEQDPPPLSEWTAEIPDNLDQVIQRATRRDRRRRYAHGTQLADELGTLCGPRAHQITRHLATSPPTPRPVTPPTSTAPW